MSISSSEYALIALVAIIGYIPITVIVFRNVSFQPVL